MSQLYRNVQDRYQQVERLVNNRLASVNTNMLVEVKAIDGAKVTVEPTGFRFYTDNNLKQISKKYDSFDVNILQMSGVLVPIIVGQIGLLIINQYDIENVTEGSDPINRRFDILDGLFLPVIIPTDPISSDTLELKGTNLVTDFTSTKIKNSDADSLIKVLIDALTAVKNLETTDFEFVNPASQGFIQDQIDKLVVFNP